ncbi:MAG: 30S ribosomal protein S9 [Candidatus Shikimatogenerans bostrichidophilus]|nr:MAG: 30S ribosomal protein S9 [Candidatus Shikimatogenerans bostrichidophilus]
MKYKKKIYHSIGKRKTSIALAYIINNNKNKNNKIIINNKKINNYFNNNMIFKKKIYYPLELTDNLKKFNFFIKVKGGGLNSQSEAISLAISRILIKINKKFKKILKKKKLLTRDSRIVERKKFGKKKARKKFQFSKR